MYERVAFRPGLVCPWGAETGGRTPVGLLYVPRGLVMLLVEECVCGEAQRKSYCDRGLAVGQSRVLVEDPLRDDLPVRVVLSRAVRSSGKPLPIP